MFFLRNCWRILNERSGNCVRRHLVKEENCPIGFLIVYTIGDHHFCNKPTNDVRLLCQLRSHLLTARRSPWDRDTDVLAPTLGQCRTRPKVQTPHDRMREKISTFWMKLSGAQEQGSNYRFSLHVICCRRPRVPLATIMNQELIQNKFPTLQRSGATVSASGVPGSSARPSLAPNQQSHSRAIQIQSISRPLFEEGTEGPNIGTFTNDDQFLISESTVRGKYPKQQLVAPILTHRASAPPLKDYDARIMRLPRKTSLALGKLKRKKKSRKGRKTNEQKRRRSLSPRR